MENIYILFSLPFVTNPAVPGQPKSAASTCHNCEKLMRHIQHLTAAIQQSQSLLVIVSNACHPFKT